MDNFENEQLGENEVGVPAETAEPEMEKAEEETVKIEASEDAASFEEAAPQQPDVTAEQPSYEPAPQKIEYTPVNEVKDYKPASKGLRFFTFVLCVIIALTAACTIGYFFGKSGSLPSTKKVDELTLASRPDNKDEMTAAQVYEKVNASIVGIRVYNANGTYSDSSGVIYSKDGYVITNDHIYAEISAPKFMVYTFDGKEYDATYVAGDNVSDLAVLKIDASGFTPAVLGDSAEVFCGENVVAIGRPSDALANSTITCGIVSLPRRRMQITSSYSTNFIQTDSAINPGSSGGALCDMYGHVIGITSSKLSGAQYDAIGFAIPTTTLKRIIPQLINNKKVVDRAKIGITYSEVTSVMREVKGYGSTGLLVASISEDSDAYGKVKEGDIITHINDIAIVKGDVALDIIDESKAGDTLKLTVLDANGKTSEYKIKLGANQGESSFNPLLETQGAEITEGNKGAEDSEGGTFNFPFGN